MSKNMNKVKKRKDKKKSNTDYKWVITITVLAFFISLVFSVLSELVIPNVNIVISIVLVLLVVFIGIIFDMVGVSVTVADISKFHAMAAKKIKGANLAINFINNSAKVSSICNDVIGDICGIISGTCVGTIAVMLALMMGVDSIIPTLIITAFIAALTIGGKALGKGLAISKADFIVEYFAKIISFFVKEK